MNKIHPTLETSPQQQQRRRFSYNLQILIYSDMLANLIWLIVGCFQVQTTLPIVLLIAGTLLAYKRTSVGTKGNRSERSQELSMSYMLAVPQLVIYGYFIYSNINFPVSILCCVVTIPEVVLSYVQSTSM